MEYFRAFGKILPPQEVEEEEGSVEGFGFYQLRSYERFFPFPLFFKLYCFMKTFVYFINLFVQHKESKI